MKPLHCLIIAGIVILILVLLYCIPSCRAEVIPPANLWKGIIGEAFGEGYSGMYAVACVYKNRLERGMPLGCVALKSKDLDKFVKEQGGAYEVLAKKIIHEVFTIYTHDVTNGATHYEAVRRYGWPSWSNNMIITCKIGEHYFFKER